MKLRYIISAFVLGFAALSFTACNSDDDIAEKVGDMITVITTDGAAPTAVTATLSGTISDLSSVKSSTYTVGFVYGTSQDVTSSGSKAIGSLDVATGKVSATVSGLKEGTTYYYAVYATLQNIVTEYGDVKSFTATDAAILTNEATEVSATSAILNGQVNGVGSDLDAVKIGFKLSASEEDVTESVHDSSLETAVAGTFDVTYKGLFPEHTYYYVAYAVIDGNIQYGEPQSFTTPSQEMEWVDLGLDVLWAKYNVGAQAENEVGSLVGYGDITGLATSTSISSYVAENISETDNDVAYSVFGSTTAEMNFTPTEAEFNQLLANTTQKWEEVDGVKGIRFTAKNGNSIFMPAAGYREGTSTVDESDLYYWTGEMYSVNSSYAKVVSAKDGADAKVGISKLFEGMPVRPVQRALKCNGIPIKKSRLVTGDIEGKGTYRIEIYNAYGSTANNSPINPDDVQFTNDMKVVFTISGLPEDSSYQAYLAFADASWDPSNWQYNADGNASCIIKGDGTYTLDFIPQTAGEGAAVFCIDIPNLASDCPTGIYATVDEISFDHYLKNPSIKIDNSKVVEGDLEGKGTYRAEIYNEYGSSKSDPSIETSDVKFDEVMRVIFTISGLGETTSNSYQAYLAYADKNWGASNWGYNENGNGSCLVTGDGTYTIDLATGPGEGAVVFCLDILDLAKDFPTGVDVNIDKIIMDPDDTHEVTPEAGKAIFCNKDGNGVDGRIEIYNEYGSTKANPCIDPSEIVFSKNMAVTYTIKGITGNLTSDAPEQFITGLSYTDPTWNHSYWTNMTLGKYENIVTGDGTYTVWMETSQKCDGALVFCVEIGELWKYLVDPTKVEVSVDAIVMDAPFTFSSLNHDIINFQNKDGNGTDGRIDIYNEYSTSGAAAPQCYNSSLHFNGLMQVTFKISGIDNNLVEGAAGEYKADLSYADASWSPSSWGTDYGYTTVKGDGTYTVYAVLAGECEGAVVWTVELYDLWKDLVDTSLVSVDVKKVVIPGQLSANATVSTAVLKSAGKVIRLSR